MALQWDWKEDKCGILTIQYKNMKTKRWRTADITLYQGNALLIMLDEYKKNGEDYYNMWNFFVDEKHMNNCLGLSAGHNENIFNTPTLKLKKLRLQKSKNRYTNKIVKAFKKAMSDLEIEVVM